MLNKAKHPATTEHGRAGGRHAERSEASGFTAPISQILRRCAPQNDGWRYRRSAIHTHKARRAQGAQELRRKTPHRYRAKRGQDAQIQVGRARHCVPIRVIGASRG